MKAKISPKIMDRPRVELQEVIPLPYPFSIQLDISDACNLKCNFCFHSDVESICRNHVKFGIMDYSLYCNIIDGIKESWGDNHEIKKLRLFANGEPLLNPRVIDMIEYADRMKIAEVIEITTNGTLIDDYFVENVAKSGLGIINISVNGLNASQYKEFCGVSIEWDAFVENIAKLFDKRGDCRIFIKLSNIGYSQEEIDLFYQTFGDICDNIFVEGLSADIWKDTDVHNKINVKDMGLYGDRYTSKKVCTSVFTTLFINSFGIAKLCCLDWKSQYVIGDLNRQRIDEIWTGEKLSEIQKKFLQDGRCIPLCEGCDWPEMSTPDNIDLYTDILLERIEQRKR